MSSSSSRLSCRCLHRMQRRRRTDESHVSYRWRGNIICGRTFPSVMSFSQFCNLLFFIIWRCRVGVPDILTAEELSPSSRLCVCLSVQLLLKLNVQLFGVKRCTAGSLLGTVTDPTCLETNKTRISLGLSRVESYFCDYQLLCWVWQWWVLPERVVVVTPHTRWYTCSSHWREWTKLRLSLSCCWRTLTSCCSLSIHTHSLTDSKSQANARIPVDNSLTLSNWSPQKCRHTHLLMVSWFLCLSCFSCVISWLWASASAFSFLPRSAHFSASISASFSLARSRRDASLSCSTSLLLSARNTPRKSWADHLTLNQLRTVNVCLISLYRSQKYSFRATQTIQQVPHVSVFSTV